MISPTLPPALSISCRISSVLTAGMPQITASTARASISLLLASSAVLSAACVTEVANKITAAATCLLGMSRFLQTHHRRDKAPFYADSVGCPLWVPHANQECPLYPLRTDTLSPSIDVPLSATGRPAVTCPQHGCA